MEDVKKVLSSLLPTTRMNHPFIILAQFSDQALNRGLGGVIQICQNIAMAVFLMALMVSAIMYTTGRTEHLKYGLIGTAIGGLSWLIVTTMFAASGHTPDIQLPGN